MAAGVSGHFCWDNRRTCNSSMLDIDGVIDMIKSLVVSALVAACLLAQGCVLKSRVVDEVQVDALTYCTSDGSSSGASWGRMQRKGASDADEVEWSHYAIGMFACRTQDEWLCRARTGRNDCASMDLRTQLDGGVAGSTRMGVDLRKLIRNETQSEMVTQSDRICDRYLASIFGEQAGNALMLDTTMSLLNGAASIATGNTARNLSASSAFLGATKSHIDADVYQSQVSTAINLMIRKNRATARETIRNNQACAPDAYSAADAVQDALSYHNACSFEHGLGQLVHEASDSSAVRAPVAALALQRLQNALAAEEAVELDGLGAAERQQRIDYRTNLRSRIQAFEGFGIVVPAVAVPTSGNSDEGTAVKAKAKGTVPATSGSCMPLSMTATL